MISKTMKNILIYSTVFLFWSCSMSSEKGQAVGFVTHFSKSGVIWKSWDLELNMSQTGMTSTANERNFSIDNENEDPAIIAVLDSAQKFGWKVQVDYQQNFATNCMNNRGSSSAFIKKVEVLDRTPLGGIKDGNINHTDSLSRTGKVIDTIYVVIVPKQK